MNFVLVAELFHLYIVNKVHIMKILHLSDLHIGKIVNGFSMLEDQLYINQQIINLIKQEHIEAIIVAGDIFDKTLPSSKAVQVFDKILNSWADFHLPIFLISGNHDSAERLAFGSHIFKHEQIYISPVYDGKIMTIKLNDAYGELNFYLLPFIKPAMVRPFFPEKEITSYNQAVDVALSELNLNLNERNILIAHQFVTGAKLSDSEEIVVGGVDNIEADLCKDFDYVALGHIHTPQTIKYDYIRYCGTLLKYSFSEANQQKSATIIDLKAKGDYTITTYPLKPLHDMRKLTGTYMSLTDRKNYEHTAIDDYLQIILTDEEDIPDAINRLRSIYPNIMQLTYDNKRTRLHQEIKPTDINKMQTPLDLFNTFYQMQNNQSLNDKQMDILHQLIEETWEEN